MMSKMKKNLLIYPIIKLIFQRNHLRLQENFQNSLKMKRKEKRREEKRREEKRKNYNGNITIAVVSLYTKI